MKRKEFINELVKHGFTIEEAEELVNSTENAMRNVTLEELLNRPKNKEEMN